MLRGVRTALSFLTVLPFPAPRDFRPEDLGRAAPHYPLAGYVVGGVVAAVLWAPLPIPAGVRGALALLAWLLVTGMLHLDGLLDSADALLAPVSPQRRLEILRDVRVGAFGVGVGVATLLLLWSGLRSAMPGWAPVVAAVSARFAVTGPLAVFPAARGDGLGAAAQGGRWWWWGGLYVLPVLLLPGAWLAVLLTVAVAWLGAWWASRRLGDGITGDVVGALIVVAEVAALLPYVIG